MAGEKFTLTKPRSHSEKRTRTVVDTVMVTPDIINKWLSPPFQRPIKENERVREVAEELKADGGVFPGIITLGILGGETYLLDGQHRRLAFQLSGLKEGYTDVRTHYCETMAEMGEEFVRLNSQLVRMRPDDILRGLEESNPPMSYLRAQCPFVGYDMVRHGSANCAMVSMSALLRCWKGSEGDVPSTTGGTAFSASRLGPSLSMEEAHKLAEFMKLFYEAIGRDQEYNRLWGNLNIILCMWLYRNIVLSVYSKKSPKIPREMFKKCLMSLSASGTYLDWLLGRQLGERDRSPAYAKIKSIFARRILEETGKAPFMPAPAWAHGGGARLGVTKD